MRRIVTPPPHFFSPISQQTQVAPARHSSLWAAQSPRLCRERPSSVGSTQALAEHTSSYHISTGRPCLQQHHTTVQVVPVCSNNKQQYRSSLSVATTHVSIAATTHNTTGRPCLQHEVYSNISTNKVDQSSEVVTHWGLYATTTDPHECRYSSQMWG